MPAKPGGHIHLKVGFPLCLSADPAETPFLTDAEWSA
jgi:hypothetical protein